MSNYLWDLSGAYQQIVRDRSYQRKLHWPLPTAEQKEGESIYLDLTFSLDTASALTTYLDDQPGHKTSKTPSSWFRFSQTGEIQSLRPPRFVSRLPRNWLRLRHSRSPIPPPGDASAPDLSNVQAAPNQPNATRTKIFESSLEKFCMKLVHGEAAGV